MRNVVWVWSGVRQEDLAPKTEALSALAGPVSEAYEHTALYCCCNADNHQKFAV